MYFNKIVVGMDGSDHAMKALELAVQLEDKFDSTLYLLSVYRHFSQFESSHSLIRPRNMPPSPDDALKGIAQEIVEMAMERAKELGASNAVGVVRRGKPSRSILEFAKDKEADCIIMGRRGIGDGGGGLLGSVSHKVATLAPCTCIAVT
jgi:nucleotide-binding universal stress UspA family protein